ncbi:ATP-binding cassette sub-family D member 4 [Strongyloides ratti]|uniref:ATP-binding cassette sub-family D member 4 n=1 Tax=Strongyloides ratti TaxID=34506 RepID=A0A090LNW2_STRRB|nr:ATP-binding cassette sub-family D member 4 [Strongyloides ratti]CEF69879.1 ATP-binding cassette sub-family D member 4 [Strongyloides ratti]
MQQNDDFYFDRKFLKAFIHLLYHFFPKNDCKSFILIIITLIFSIISEVAIYFIGMLPGQFFYVLLKKQTDQFWEIICIASLIYLGKSIILALTSLSINLLYLTFRKNITNAIHKRYFKGITAYKLINNSFEKIDNPDQRITQDVERMCKNLSEKILPPAIICPFIIGYYSYQTYKTVSIYGLLVIYIYFIVGTIVNKILINPLAKYTARVEKAEGNYRYKHVSIRDNSEQIALYRCQEFEKIQSNYIFKKLIKVQFIHCLWKIPNLIWQNFFDNTGGILGYALQFIPFILFQSYLHTETETLAKIISNNAFIYIYLINSFTRLTDIGIVFGDTAGILQRVEQLLLACKNMKNNEYSKLIPYKEEDKNINYIFNDVSLTTQYGQPIVKHFSLILNSNENLLINGVSGTGKTSLLRMIIGIWKNNSGEIFSKFNINDIEIIPQNSYLPVGHLSLYQQLLFPSIYDANSPDMVQKEKQLFQLFEDLNLLTTIKRLDYIYEKPDFEFINHLTPGEVQRLVFIRAIIKNPKLIILDESTNAVGVAMEGKMYEILNKNNIQYISVGHRDSLRQYHHKCLTLTGYGDFDLDIIKK